MPHRFTSDFTRRIRRRRTELSLTQREVADHLSLTSDSVGLVENGYRRFDLDRIPELADALSLDRVELCRQALQIRAPRLYQVLFPEPPAQSAQALEQS